MPLCDTLLRLAEDPAMYRPLWGDQILQEVGAALVSKLQHTEPQRNRRLTMMQEAFPEALIRIPDGFAASLKCIPDEKDRHVLAVAICGHANAIVTHNTRDFPPDCGARTGSFCRGTLGIHELIIGLDSRRGLPSR